MLCKEGISQPGSESVPLKADPSNEVENFTLANRLLRYVLNAGMPQTAQQMIRITHGIHAWMVSFVVYGYL